MRAAELLRDKGVRVGGFLQLPREDELGRKWYDLLRLSRGQKMVLAGPASGPAVEEVGKTSLCSFVFHDETFAAAQAWVQEDSATADVLMIDEVSKLEVGGKGHHDAVVTALGAAGASVVVLCIRADQLFYVVDRFGLQDDAVGVLELPADDCSTGQFASQLAEACAAAARR
jgi:nucleoside-triphosphatase THEP1